MRFFPIVPHNVPRDDLAKYLELYNSEAEGLLQSYGAGARVHSEWDINVRAPVMRSGVGLSGTQASTRRPNGRLVSPYHYPGELAGTEAETRRPTGDPVSPYRYPGELARTIVSRLQLLDQGFGAIGSPMGVDPATRYNVAAGTATTPTLWAQRAANGWYAQMGLPTRVVTDGVSGPQTLSALQALRIRMLTELQAHGTLPTAPRIVAQPAIVDRSHVSMSGFMHDSLMSVLQTEDVSDPTAAPRAETETESFPGAYVGPLTTVAGSSGALLAVALGAGAWYLFRR